MTTSTQDIYESIKSGAGDTALNAVIQQYLDDEPSLDTDVINWRIEKYNLLQGWAVPPVADYTSAKSMIETGDTFFDADLRAAGDEALTLYYQQYHESIERFPAENINAGNNNYTAWKDAHNTLTQQVGGATGFITGNGQEDIYVSGKWIDNRNYDISGSVAGDDQYISFTDIPGFYKITFSGPGIKHKTFNVAKKGEKTLYAVASLSNTPVDAHRNLIARAIWQHN